MYSGQSVLRRLIGNKSNVWLFVVGCVVPDHMNDAFVRVAGLNLGQKLCCADTIHSGWLNKWHIEGFRIERAMDIPPAHAPALSKL
jgi:hypothetical protein